MSTKISVIIPVKNINDYIRESVLHLAELDYPDFEVLILPDHDTGERFSDARIFVLPTYPQTGPADKRDLGAKAAKGEILAFLDDDAYPHKNWLKSAIDYFNDSDISAVCGPGVTPPNDSALQKASGWVQASKLGGGNCAHRFIPQAKRNIDDYPSMNLLVRKSDFEAIGGFDSHFWPGEDTKLCLDLTQKIGKKIIYDPAVLVYHHRRALFRPYLKQIGGYGLHRGHFARILPQTSRRPSYFVPAAFTLFIGTFAVVTAFLNFAPVLQTVWLGMVGVLAFYVALLLATAGWVCKNERSISVALLTIPGIVSTHLWYGLRFIQGFFSPKLTR